MSESDRTSITLDERTRNRLRSAKISGESYSDCVNRLLDTAVGRAKGEKVEIENICNTPRRVDDHWLDPGETAEMWSENSAVIGAEKQGFIDIRQIDE